MANPKQEVKYTKLFINNEFVDSVSGKKFATYNPATEEKIAEVSEGDKADIDLAVAAAKKAFARGSEYRNLDASARGKLLWKLADLIERDHEILANLESQDGGKPYYQVTHEIISSANALRYYAGWADKSHGKTIPADGSFFAYTRKEPVGVVGQIIPWNAPFLMLTWKWGCAVASGCTSVIKPAEQTPLTALYAAALAKEAGFPPGVLNVVTGYGETAGHALTIHPDVRKIAFTGSLEVGRIIMENAAKSNLKKVSLELGGKSPLVVFDDADLETAVQIAHIALFANQGQVCCAGSRLFVQEGIYDKFVKRSIEVAKARRVGDPYDKTTEQGPQIDKIQFDRVLSYIDLGVKQGAKLETGGKRLGKKGFFIEPTVFSNVTDEMTIAKDEIFGPVQSIFKFKTLDEVIERANNTNFGLSAGVITKNIDTALTFSHAVEAGSVWVNTYLAISPQTPFGGYKESGLGREMGDEGLDLYLETKLVSIKLPSKN